MPDLTLSFFGLLLVTQNGSPVTGFRSHKERALLAYLAEEADRPHLRSSLTSLFWPEMSEDVARNNLSQTLGRLRRHLEEDGSHLEGLHHEAEMGAIKANREQIQFTLATHIHIDARQLQAEFDHLHFAKDEHTEDIRHLEAALHLYRGEFLLGLSLPECEEFEQWLRVKRAYYQRLVVDGLDRLASLYLAGSRYADAQTVAHRHLAIEPWAESAHRQLMKALVLNGQRAAALTQYERCRNVLMAELAIAPEAETTALFQQIQRGELHGGATAQAPPVPVVVAHDWHEMPTLPNFFGRSAEQAQLQQWLVADRCALVAILGMGGQGKTSLAAQLVPAIAAHYDGVIWRSLLNAPPLEELLATILPTHSGQQASQSTASLDQKLALFFTYLQQRRLLLVLDNLESILQAGMAGQYRPGYEAYGQLLQGMATRRHQSQLLFTSRERSRGVERWERDSALVRTLRLGGLDAIAGHQLLNSRGVVGARVDGVALSERYSGNPLALKLVADTVQDFFLGDLREFLTEETPIFSDVRLILDQQFARLSDLEQELLFWLAIEREVTPIQTLEDDFLHPPPRGVLLEALQALQRRSLIEQQVSGFGLQNVIAEYLTDRLVKEVVQEFQSGSLSHLHRFALLKTQTQEFVLRNQIRMFLQPIVRQLERSLGRIQLAAQAQALIKQCQAHAPQCPSYAPGNILNLLFQAEIDVSGYDFSRLNIRQGYLQNRALVDVDFSEVDFVRSTFTDSFGAVYSVAIHPQGHLLAAGIDRGEVRLWERASGQLVKILRGHMSAIRAVAFSPDGRYIASGSLDHTVRLWDVDSGQVVRTFYGHEGGVLGVAFSPDGVLLASGSGDTRVCLWEVSSGQRLAMLTQHTAQVNAVTFSPDGDLLVSGSNDHTVCIWPIRAIREQIMAQSSPQSNTIEIGQAAQRLTDLGSFILSLAFNHAGTILATGESNGAIHLYQVDQSKWLVGVHRLTGPQNESDGTHWIRAIAFSPDGTKLVAANANGDKGLSVWDVERKVLVERLPGHENTVWSLAISPDGQSVVSGSFDNTIRIWNLYAQRRADASKILQGYGTAVNTVSFSPDHTTLAAGDSKGIIHVWQVAADGTTQGQRRVLTGHEGQIRAIVFSPDGHYIASASSEGAIRLWHLVENTYLSVFDPQKRDITSVVVHPNGQLLASAGNDPYIRLWAFDPLRKFLLEKTAWKQGDCFIEDLSFHPNGHVLAGTDDDGKIYLWELTTGRCIQALDNVSPGFKVVAFSTDGKWLAAGGKSGPIGLWAVDGDNLLKQHHLWRGHANQITRITFSPDGRYLATASHDGTVGLWVVETGEKLRGLQGHTQMVKSVAFHADGKLLASGSNDGTVRLWDVATGRCVNMIHLPRPYDGMKIGGATGISMAQRAALQALGAIET